VPYIELAMCVYMLNCVVGTWGQPLHNPRQLNRRRRWSCGGRFCRECAHKYNRLPYTGKALAIGQVVWITK